MSAAMTGSSSMIRTVGGQFGVDLGLGLGDQAFDLAEVAIQDLSGFGRGEAFQGGKQERLARTRGDAHQTLRGVVGGGEAVITTRFELSAGRQPDGVEHAIQRDARRQVVIQRTLAGGEGFQSDADIVVAGVLVAGKGAGVATNIRQMRRQPSKKTHDPSRCGVFDKNKLSRSS
jgi:hypothetical protein